MANAEMIKQMKFVAPDMTEAEIAEALHCTEREVVLALEEKES